MTEFMYQTQYSVPLIFVPCFPLFSPIASIPETVAESEEDTQEKLKTDYLFLSIPASFCILVKICFSTTNR